MSIQDWANVGQAVEGLGVIAAGIAFLIWQLRRIRQEAVHRKWDGLVWATSLVDGVNWGLLAEGLGDQREAVERGRLLNVFNVLQLAVEDGYLDSHLLLEAFAEDIAWAADNVLDPPWGMLDRPEAGPTKRLVKVARAWRQRHSDG